MRSPIYQKISSTDEEVETEDEDIVTIQQQFRVLRNQGNYIDLVRLLCVLPELICSTIVLLYSCKHKSSDNCTSLFRNWVLVHTLSQILWIPFCTVTYNGQCKKERSSIHKTGPTHAERTRKLRAKSANRVYDVRFIEQEPSTGRIILDLICYLRILWEILGIFWLYIYGRCNKDNTLILYYYTLILISIHLVLLLICMPINKLISFELESIPAFNNDSTSIQNTTLLGNVSRQDNILAVTLSCQCPIILSIFYKVFNVLNCICYFCCNCSFDYNKLFKLKTLNDYIKCLPMRKINRTDIKNELSCDMCAIPFKLNTFVIQLNCGHNLHESCELTQGWLFKNRKCPFCNERVVFDLSKLSQNSKLIRDDSDAPSNDDVNKKYMKMESEIDEKERELILSKMKENRNQMDKMLNNNDIEEENKYPNNHNSINNYDSHYKQNDNNNNNNNINNNVHHNINNNNVNIDMSEVKIDDKIVNNNNNNNNYHNKNEDNINMDKKEEETRDDINEKLLNDP